MRGNTQADDPTGAFSIAELLDSFRVVERLYGLQLDHKLELAQPANLGTSESARDISSNSTRIPWFCARELYQIALPPLLRGFAAV